ncbi:MAG: hypothetical protein IH616_16065 [Gemmatimonadales bacterium]|nr:hypothetical protein [Gemmatimonadales bacterium]
MIYRTLASISVLLTASALGVLAACAQESPAEQQIAGAVSPLPESMRDGAAVLGYRRGKLVSLRDGTNGMICLADDPAQEGFHAACYHRDLEPFMARGRALKAEGKDRSAIDSVRQAEIESGTLNMVREPRALYSLSSKLAFDPATGTAPESSALRVIYMPFATEESTGISATPGAGPWLMYPGKPWAHVMIAQ